MCLLKGIDLLLEVDVFGGQLGLQQQRHVSSESATRAAKSLAHTNLVIGLAELLLGVLKGTRRKGRDLRTKVTAWRKTSQLDTGTLKNSPPVGGGD